MAEKRHVVGSIGLRDNEIPWAIGVGLAPDFDSGPGSDPDEPAFTSGQAARLLGIPARTMRHYLSTGRAGGVQNPITGTWHISKRALHDFASRRGQEPAGLGEPATVVVVEPLTEQAGDLARAIDGFSPGSRTVHVADGFDGLVQAAALVPDVLVFDAELPELSGADLIRVLRRNPRTAGIRTLALVSREGTAGQLRGAGADVVLSRNAGPAELVEALGQLLTARGSKPTR